MTMMMMMTKENPKPFFFGLPSMFLRVTSNNKKALLVLPLLCALLMTVGRSVYQSSYGASSSHPSSMVHRYAASAPVNQKNQKAKTKAAQKEAKETTQAKEGTNNLRHGKSLGQILNRGNAVEHLVSASFKPSNRDVHLHVFPTKDHEKDHALAGSKKHRSVMEKQKHGVEVSVGLRRKLANDCPILPSLTCDTLFALSHDHSLYSVNLVTGKETLIGQTGLNFHADGMAYDPYTKELYGIDRSDNPNNSDQLIKIDPCTGKGTAIGPCGINIWELAIDSQGKMFGWSMEDLALASIDRATGAATVIGTPQLVPMDSRHEGPFNFAFDDHDVLHLVSNRNNHYIIDAATGKATLEGPVDPKLPQSFTRGDIKPGTNILYSPFVIKTGLHVVDLAKKDQEGTVIPTEIDFYSATFACDMTPVEYRFQVEANKTVAYDLTKPQYFKLNPPAPDDPPPEYNPPAPGHVAKPPSGGSPLLNEMKELLKDIDTGNADTRYEVPGHTDFTIPFVFFMQINVQLAKPGRRARVKLHVYRHPETPEGDMVLIVDSGPMISYEKGVVFFVPLQAGNFTTQLVDPKGIPIEDSANMQNATFNVKTFPYPASTS